MLVDPICVSLLPEVETLRIVGRLASLDRLGVHAAMLALGLVLLSCDHGGVQPFSLCSGLRGARHMKSFFYIFSPAHLAASRCSPCS